MSVEMPTSYSP